jgi:hypothetical protein
MDLFALGAFSAPRVGAMHEPARRPEPEDGTLFFVGEAACGDRHPASVHGAIESGARAAVEMM